MTENLQKITVSHDEYSSILRTAIDGFFIVDASGRFLEVNDVYCMITGYSHAELLNLSLEDVEAAECPEEVARHMEKVSKTGGDRFETRQRCKDGRVIDMEVSVNYMNVKGGRFFSFIRDITMRKRAEEEREKLIIELQEALDKVKLLGGLLPICAFCKKIRDDEGYWQDVASYITTHSEATFSHGYCPECCTKHYPGLFKGQEKT